MAVDGALEPAIHGGQINGMAACPDLCDLERAIEHRFGDRALLELALTHSSAATPVGGRAASYQRLEFLGDRVLGLCASDLLIATHPRADEGELSRRLADLVRKDTCADVALAWNAGPHLRLGAGEMVSGARRNRAILADVCEGIIGAIFLDAGYEAARGLVERAFGERMRLAQVLVRDAKSALQEWAQGRGLPTPTYAIVARSGPDHAPRFRIAVSIEGLDQEESAGNSRRLAEQGAAERLLLREGVWRSDADG